MNIEKIVGLIFSISLLLVLLFVVLTPQIDYQQEFTISDLAINETTAEEQEVVEMEEKETEILKENPIFESDVANIKISDFDLFVLRVHVLSCLLYTSPSPRDS